MDSILVCSLYNNDIGPEGARYLSEGLKANGALTSLEYAAMRLFPYC